MSSFRILDSVLGMEALFRVEFRLRSPRLARWPSEWPASIAQWSRAQTKNTCSRQRIAKVAGPRGALLCVPFTHISRRMHARRAAPAVWLTAPDARLASPRVSSRTTTASSLCFCMQSCLHRCMLIGWRHFGSCRYFRILYSLNTFHIEASSYWT